MGWHKKHLEAKSIVPQAELFKRLRERYNMNDTILHEVQVTLPSSGVKVNVPCHNMYVMVRDLLTDPRIQEKDYLFFNDDARQGQPEEVLVLGDINTGLAYRKTYDQLIKPEPQSESGRWKVLCPCTVLNTVMDVSLVQLRT